MLMILRCYLSWVVGKDGTTNTEKGLLVSGMQGFTLNYGKEQFKKITFAEVDKRIYGFTPMPIDGPWQDIGRY